jgi:hypothetical protein
MTAEVQQIAVLVAFCLLMLLVNLKAGTSSWSGSLLKWATFCLLLLAIGVLTWRVAQVVL